MTFTGQVVELGIGQSTHDVLTVLERHDVVDPAEHADGQDAVGPPSLFDLFLLASLPEAANSARSGSMLSWSQPDPPV